MGLHKDRTRAEVLVLQHDFELQEDLETTGSHLHHLFTILTILAVAQSKILKKKRVAERTRTYQGRTRTYHSEHVYDQCGTNAVETVCTRQCGKLTQLEFDQTGHRERTRTY